MTKLQSVGITQNELRVYETLLRYGASTISFLSNKAKMNQRSTYDYIERLIYKGLVGHIKLNNKRLFLGLNPEMLLYTLEEERKATETEFKELEKLAKTPKRDVQLNLIDSKTSFLKLIKNKKGKSDVSIGKECEEITKNPNFAFFIKNNRPKITDLTKKPILQSTAKAICIFIDETFIIYSVPEEKGFFVNDRYFTENMRVYFE